MVLNFNTSLPLIFVQRIKLWLKLPDEKDYLFGKNLCRREEWVGGCVELKNFPDSIGKTVLLYTKSSFIFTKGEIKSMKVSRL